MGDRKRDGRGLHVSLLLAVAAGGLAMLPGPRAARAAQVRIDPNDAPHIVNGIDTHAYPSTGALLYGGGVITPDNASIWCSGTLIGCETFLVAAHCVDDLQPTHYLVYLQNAGLVPVAAITRHPSYQDADFPRFDVAVLKLATWVTGITPTPINEVDPLPFAPADGTIVGFGQTRGGGNDYGIKRAGAVQTTRCPADLPSGATDADVLCWRFAAPLGTPGTHSNTCNGDSGGPLFLDLGAGPVLAGTTSGGTSEDCLPVDNSYDANVFTHRDFILGQLGSDATATCGGLAPVDDAATTVIGEDASLDALNAVDTYTITVPPAANALRVALNGEDNGTFDVNLYVKRGLGASASSFDCKADGQSAFGACTFDLPSAGTWSVAVARAAGAGPYQLTSTVFGGAAPVCGNGTREFNEACDGADAALCPGQCAGDCTCPPPTCGNGVLETGEECDGSDAPNCPGQCDASCHCPLVCTQDDLVDVMARIDATHLRLRGRLLNFGGAFDGADPRNGFALVLTQGASTLSVTIPADDSGWAASAANRGRYTWAGSRNGVTRIKAIDHSARTGTWKIVVVGADVPGAGVIDAGQPFDVRLTIDQACTQTTF
jgi:hypothetical protein